MLPDGRRIGAHLPLAPGMVKAVDRAHAIGASAIQVFADNPTAWRRRRAPSPQLATFRERTEAFDIRPVSIHASYLVNLPGPDAVTFERSVVDARVRARYGSELRRRVRERPHRVASRGRSGRRDRPARRGDRPGPRRGRVRRRRRPGSSSRTPRVGAAASGRTSRSSRRSRMPSTATGSTARTSASASTSRTRGGPASTSAIRGRSTPSSTCSRSASGSIGS